MEIIIKKNENGEYDYSSLENNKWMRFIREDRNGTRFYEDHRCSKCGGTGYLPYYDYIDGGRCFQCGGSGERVTKIKALREDYYREREAKRIAKEREKAPETNRKWFTREGLSETGEAWAVLGNTYEIKEELKAAGAKFNPTLGWHFDHEVEGYRLMKFEADEMIEYTGLGTVLGFRCAEIQDRIKAANEALKREGKPESQYIGKIGDRIEITLTQTAVHWYETPSFTGFGKTTCGIYCFTDSEGNVLVWKTSGCGLETVDENGDYKPVMTGDTVKIRGTIKDHSEYRGQKQTVLSRCRVA